MLRRTTVGTAGSAAALAETIVAGAPGRSVFAQTAAVCGAYAELAKPRVTALILPVAAAGYWLGSNRAPDPLRLAQFAAGIVFLAAGVFSLNQYLDRDQDARMKRTENRPLPSGRLRPGDALAFGVVMSVLAVGWLSLFANNLTGLLAFATLAGYVLIYTPLKTVTPHCTLIGAFPGAMPPLLGWAAAQGRVTPGGLALFAILFFWQFPHFHAIAMLYRDEYARAGVRLWTVVEADGRTARRQIAVFTAALLPVSVLPAAAGTAGLAYACGAAILGGAFFAYACAAALDPARDRARKLLLASVLYLPALFALMAMGGS